MIEANCAELHESTCVRLNAGERAVRATCLNAEIATQAHEHHAMHFVLVLMCSPAVLI